MCRYMCILLTFDLFKLVSMYKHAYRQASMHACRHIALCSIPFRCSALQSTALHCNALHCIPSHTLHYSL